VLNKELHIIGHKETIRKAMETLTSLGKNLTLFVINENKQLVGVVTDGNIRRGLVSGVNIDDEVREIMNINFKYLFENKFSFEEIVRLREESVKIIPFIDKEFKIKRIENINSLKSILPVDVVLMAGGRGERLMPLTANKPKPMLEISGKPILERNIELLASYGIHNIYISVYYLSHQITSYFGDGKNRGLKIGYIEENKPLGTLAAVRMNMELKHDDIIVMNSDLLTNINFEDFYKTFKKSDADMAIATTRYNVTVPYAVLETVDNFVQSFKEKPSYTYYSNAGIYLIKRSNINIIPLGSHYDATDMIADLLKEGKKIISYPILGYWLDIGKHEDYAKAQEDFKHIVF
jgi:dTDP-glucose pyrophosphorylase